MTSMYMSKFPPLLSEVKQLYQKHANKENALPMANYLKNQFEFYGIKMPERRALTKQLLKMNPKLSVDELIKIIHASFQEKFREIQYFAMELAYQYINRINKYFIDIAKHMITSKSWWDTVDFIATKIIGSLVKNYPELIQNLDQWINDDNIWLRRTAILFQLKYKSQTDEDRLFRYCYICKDSNEFFIQKAIGWALREHSKTKAEKVKTFVENTSLAPLSKREALKWILKKG